MHIFCPVPPGGSLAPWQSPTCLVQAPLNPLVVRLQLARLLVCLLGVGVELEAVAGGRQARVCLGPRGLEAQRVQRIVLGLLVPLQAGVGGGAVGVVDFVPAGQCQGLGLRASRF